MSSDKKQIFREMMSDSKIKDCLLSKEKPENLDDLAVVVGGVAVEYGYPLSKHVEYYQ